MKNRKLIHLILALAIFIIPLYLFIFIYYQSESWRRTFNRGVDLEQQGEYLKAYSEYEQIIINDIPPDSCLLSAYDTAARCQFLSGDVKKAWDIYNEKLEKLEIFRNYDGANSSEIIETRLLIYN